MRKGLIYKFMIAFVAFAVIGLLPFKTFADTTITITTQPVDYTGSVGGVATFSVVAEGDDLTYQWQAYSSGTWKASSMPGAKTSTLSIDITNNRDGYQYRCEIKDAVGNVVNSNPASLHVRQTVKITTNPSSFNVPVGSVATFSVAAEGDDLTYQWQVNTSGTWKNSSLTGYNTNTLTVDAFSSRNGYKFRCVVRDGTGNSATSGEATLTIAESDAITITSNPVDYSGPVGGVATFAVVAEGNGLTYQWQVNTAGTWKNSTLPGYKTSTLTVDAFSSRDGYKFRCVITDAAGNTKTSGEATLTIAASDAITITSEPSDLEAPVGSVAEFTVVADGNGLTYQWQVNTAGTWKNSTLPGYKTSTLTVDAFTSRNGYKFRCVVSDAAGNTKTSGEATLTVVNKTTITVTLNGGNGNFANGKNTTTVEVNPGYFLLSDLEQPELEGYVFRGWLDGQGKSVNYVNITSETTFTADYRKINYLTLNANGGHFGNNEEELIIDFTCNIYFFDDDYDRPVRDGYRFSGWLYNGELISRRITVTEDVELIAQWEKLAYVTYNANGGFWDFENEITYTEVFEELAGYNYNIGFHDPTREGYEFKGWMLNDNWAPGKILLTDDIEVKAVWGPEVDVSYNPNGGGWTIYNFETDEHEIVTAPRTEHREVGNYNVSEEWPEREGYEFLGWSTDPNATTAEHNFNSFITDDTVYYAIWGKQGVIRYVANGGHYGFGEDESTWEDERIHYVSAGEYYYIGEQTPWREGDYRFIGWFDKDGNQMDDEEIFVTSETDITVYAKWSNRIEITYNANGGEWDYDHYVNDVFIGHITDTEQNVGTQNSGDYYMPDHWEPQREGYIFIGWALMEGDTLGDVIEDPIILPDQDITFYAKWLKLTKVYYLANGGGFPDYDENGPDGPISFYRYYIPGEEFELDGKRPEFDETKSFAGWTTVANDYSTKVPERMIAGEDLTLFAYWYQPKTITYRTTLANSYWMSNEEQNGVQINVMNVEIVRTAREQGDVDIEEWRPEVNNQPYEFLGYSLNQYATQPTYLPGEHIDFLDSDIVLYTVWEKLPVITYDAGEGKFHDGSKTREEWVRAGHMYAVRCETPQDREGYNFIGWADSYGMIRSDKEWFRLNAGDELVFKAVWEERTTCTITYDPNGGTFGYEDFDYEQDEQEVGNYGHIGTRWPDREGYDFMGWSIDPNATAGEYDWDQKITDDITVYAVWAKRVLLTLDAGEGGNMWVWHDDVWDWEQDPPELIQDGYNSLERYNPFEVLSGSVIPTYLLEVPEREGYWFEGWMDSNHNIVNYLTVGDEDITLYACWTKIYDVIFDAGEGEFGGGENSIRWDVEAGQYLQMDWAEQPVRAGYVFGGWSLGGEYITYYTVEDHDVTFEAIWIPENG